MPLWKGQASLSFKSHGEELPDSRRTLFIEGGVASPRWWIPKGFAPLQGGSVVVSVVGRSPKGS